MARTEVADYDVRRERVIDVAAAIFQCKGYDNASLDDVAAALGAAGCQPLSQRRVQGGFSISSAAGRSTGSSPTCAGSPSWSRDPAGPVDRHQAEMIAGERDVYLASLRIRRRLDPEHQAELSALEHRYFSAIADLVASVSAAGLLPIVDREYGGHALIGMTSPIFQ